MLILMKLLLSFWVGVLGFTSSLSQAQGPILLSIKTEDSPPSVPKKRESQRLKNLQSHLALMFRRKNTRKHRMRRCRTSLCYPSRELVTIVLVIFVRMILKHRLTSTQKMMENNSDATRIFELSWLVVTLGKHSSSAQCRDEL